jgi:hypothetical protein
VRFSGGENEFDLLTECSLVGIQRTVEASQRMSLLGRDLPHPDSIRHYRPAKAALNNVMSRTPRDSGLNASHLHRLLVVVD